MARIRAIEEEVVEAFAAGLIPGSTHPCIGQEAIPVGTIAQLRSDDQVLATYRGHGEALAKGVDAVAMMGELMTREGGICKGKGGSMHLSDPSVGLVSTNAIVAGHIPMAGGVALAAQRRGSGQVVAVYFGDGASCEGEFFETLNMAQLWKLPLIFVCSNNGTRDQRADRAEPGDARHRRSRPRVRHGGRDRRRQRRHRRRGRHGAAPSTTPAAARGRTSSSARRCAGSATRPSAPAARTRRRPAGSARRSTRSSATATPWSPGASPATSSSTRSTRRCASFAKRVRAEAEALPSPGRDSIYEDIFAPSPVA